ncbi:MAG: hypothetical protein N2Z76_01420 [Treponemataceae bacterium]|nr:hypothetical protein [Treponemataceae bacterium]
MENPKENTAPPCEPSIVVTQSWTEYWTVLFILWGIVFLIARKEIMSSIETFLIFVYCALQIVVPTFVFFKYLAIRRMHFTTSAIIIEIGDNHERFEYPKEMLERIEIRYVPGFSLGGRGRSEKVVFNFYLSLSFDHHLFRKPFRKIKSLLYAKKVSVSHFLLLDHSLAVLEFLEYFYRDTRLTIDPKARNWLIKTYGTGKELTHTGGT